MGLFSFVGDILGFGGGDTTTVQTKQDQNINIRTKVNIDNSGIGQGIESLGESIKEGIAEQQDVIIIDMVDENFNTYITSTMDSIKKNIIPVAMAGVLIYFYLKKGDGKFGKFKLQLPKNNLIT